MKKKTEKSKKHRIASIQDPTVVNINKITHEQLRQSWQTLHEDFKSLSTLSTLDEKETNTKKLGTSLIQRLFSSASLTTTATDAFLILVQNDYYLKELLQPQPDLSYLDQFNYRKDNYAQAAETLSTSFIILQQYELLNQKILRLKDALQEKRKILFNGATKNCFAAIDAIFKRLEDNFEKCAGLIKQLNDFKTINDIGTFTFLNHLLTKQNELIEKELSHLSPLQNELKQYESQNLPAEVDSKQWKTNIKTFKEIYDMIKEEVTVTFNEIDNFIQANGDQLVKNDNKQLQRYLTDIRSLVSQFKQIASQNNNDPIDRAAYAKLGQLLEELENKRFVTIQQSKVILTKITLAQKDKLIYQKQQDLKLRYQFLGDARLAFFLPGTSSELTEAIKTILSQQSNLDKTKFLQLEQLSPLDGIVWNSSNNLINDLNNERERCISELDKQLQTINETIQAVHSLLMQEKLKLRRYSSDVEFCAKRQRLIEEMAGSNPHSRLCNFYWVHYFKALMEIDFQANTTQQTSNQLQQIFRLSGKNGAENTVNNNITRIKGYIANFKKDFNEKYPKINYQEDGSIEYNNQKYTSQQVVAIIINHRDYLVQNIFAKETKNSIPDALQKAILKGQSATQQILHTALTEYSVAHDTFTSVINDGQDSGHDYQASLQKLKTNKEIIETVFNLGKKINEHLKREQETQKREVERQINLRIQHLDSITSTLQKEQEKINYYLETLNSIYATIEKEKIDIGEADPRFTTLTEIGMPFDNELKYLKEKLNVNQLIIDNAIRTKGTRNLLNIERAIETTQKILESNRNENRRLIGELSTQIADTLNDGRLEKLSTSVHNLLISFIDHYILRPLTKLITGNRVSFFTTPMEIEIRMLRNNALSRIKSVNQTEQEAISINQP
ncbi:hypothetical protein ACQUW5_09600 [Legionella sp. CNM-1927-20]|uniref:hypothetical protein n=1 Tax=Legionella sp. CNM-1927-20 TaxID=3422221 RepID=UPI00403A845F